MQMIKRYVFPLILILTFATLSSCFKEDELVEPPVPGNVETNSIVLGENYVHQVYFDIENNDIIADKYFDIWDLAFECDTAGWHIFLNSSKMMYAGNSNQTNFSIVPDPASLEMFIDNSDGSYDKTAIGNWYTQDSNEIISNKYVYVIDRGYDTAMIATGYKKVVFDIVDGKYLIKYANLDGSDEQSIILTKNNDYNYIYFSFDEGVVGVSPERESYTLKFSKYSTMLTTDEGDSIPYLVTGVLLNPYNTSAAMDTNSFSSITLSDTSDMVFSVKQDAIGYNWKSYNFDSGLYTVNPDMNYIIKCGSGFYYKMRFIGFYGESGQKGTITLEIAKL